MSKKTILFESYPDYSGSPLAIYNELLNKHYDEKFNLLWAVDKAASINPKFNSVRLFNESKPVKDDIISSANIIIDSNRYIHKINNHQYRLHTRHGTNLKKCAGYSLNIGDVDTLLTTSDTMRKIDAIVYPNKVAQHSTVLGLPANDALFNTVDLYNGFIQELTKSESSYSKLIGWFPTYRQHRNAPNTGSKKIYKYGLPGIYSLNDITQLNDMLAQYNVLLIIQMHHAQAKNYEPIGSYSNIVFIDSNIMKKYSLTLVNIMSSIDAMITDYSSIYFEYLLLNKPIALMVDDLIEYNDAFGFWYYYPTLVKGQYITKLNHLLSFIYQVSTNVDSTYASRHNILNTIHKYQDNKSAERVVEYLKQNNLLSL